MKVDFRFRCPSCGHEYSTYPVPSLVVCSACGVRFAVARFPGVSSSMSEEDIHLENFYAGGL